MELSIIHHKMMFLCKKQYAMRKVLLSFLVGCIGFFPSHASTVVSLDGEGKTHQGGNIGDMDEGRDLTLPEEGGWDEEGVEVECEDIYYSYDPFLSTLFVYTPVSFSSLPLYVVIDNIDTNDTFIFSPTAPGIFVVPFDGGDGHWKLRVVAVKSYLRATFSRTLYRVYFTIKNGVIIREIEF